MRRGERALPKRAGGFEVRATHECWSRGGESFFGAGSRKYAKRLVNRRARKTVKRKLVEDWA